MNYLGACLCEAIQFQIEARDPLLYGHCHCRACRKSHGADFTSATIIPADNLTITQGQAFLTTFESSPAMQRQFCRQCGSRLFVRFQRATANDQKEMVTVAINALKEVVNWRETAHIYVGSKAPWVNLHDDLPQAAENFPPP